MTQQPDPTIPAVATAATVIGGPDDGATVALIDTRDTILALVVDREGNLDARTTLNPEEVAEILRRIAQSATRRANEWKANQS